jgi:hypothetical protein
MNAMSAPKTIHAGIVSLLTLLVLSATGCSRARERDHPVANLPEPSLAEQAQAVREGRSNQIRLDRTLVVDRDLELLSGLESQLLRINFSRTEITDEGLERLGQMESLEQLRLASQRITDAGLVGLKQLEHVRFLHLIDMESLYLDGTSVTDDGIQRLVAALPQVHLHIDDHHHRLDPHGAEHSH